VRKWRDRSVCVVAAAVMTAAGAQAVTVINKTTGQTLFYDDFEAASAVSHSAYPDAGGDFDPNNAAVGAWSVNEAGPSNIQVSAYLGNGTNDPAATPQGTNYLRVVRHLATGAEVDFFTPVVQSTAGDVIHVETMVWIPGGAGHGSFQLQFQGSGGSADFRVNVLSALNNNVSAWDATLGTPNWVDTTLDWLANTWQKWEVDYAVGAETFDLTIDGVRKTLNRSGVAGNFRTLAFRCGSAAANMQFRLDATGYDGSKQGSLTLFRDGFEGGTPGAAPALTHPDIGTYLNVGSGVKVRTGDLSAGGGPTAAYSGNNYVELSRLGGAGVSLSCAFAGGAFEPDTQELRARFRLWWGGAGLPGHGISRATTASFVSTNFLTYSLIRSETGAVRAYDSYNGTAYVRIAPAGTIPVNAWFPVELVWHPTNQLATVSFNGGAAVTNVLFGAVPDMLNQVFFASGINTTVYWIDDIEAEWVYTPPPVPPPKGTLVLFY